MIRVRRSPFAVLLLARVSLAQPAASVNTASQSTTQNKKEAPGLTFKRMFTKAGVSAYDQVEQEELLSDQCYLDVATGPDGAIYMSSVNKIQRLVPER